MWWNNKTNNRQSIGFFFVFRQNHKMIWYFSSLFLVFVAVPVTFHVSSLHWYCLFGHRLGAISTWNEIFVSFSKYFIESENTHNDRAWGCVNELNKNRAKGKCDWMEMKWELFLSFGVCASCVPFVYVWMRMYEHQ